MQQSLFCALWASADDAVRQALDFLMVTPMGLTEYFGDGGLQLVGRDGLDERLQGRFRRDPAEFVTVLAGGSDGLHYGLWYDDPDELPSFVVNNYARDSAETRANGSPTLLAELRLMIDRVMSDYGDTGEEGQLLRPLIGALDWFAAADHEALQADGVPRRATQTRRSGAVSIFPTLPPDTGDPRLEESAGRISAFLGHGPQTAEWIARAERELAAGEPALALAVGGELHWVDHDEYRLPSHDLLVRAYRALGRDPLADIIEVHTAHRDLLSVDILAAPT